MIASGDEEIEALLAKTGIKGPTIKCTTGKPIERFCVNQACKFDSACCGDEDCKECEVKHDACGFFDIKRLTKRIQDKLTLNKKVLRDFFRMENEIITQLNASRKALIEKVDLLRFQSGVSEVINSLYFKANSKGLKGKQVKEIFSKLVDASKEIQSEEQMKEFKREGEKMIQSIIHLREKLLSQLIGGDKSKIDSKILLNDIDGRQGKSFILKQLGNPSKLQLLYRASQNGFSAYKFHEKCNNIPGTFTLIRTEFGKIIGGYNHLIWNNNEGQYSTDPEGKCFLLSINLKQKMSLKDKKYAVHNAPYYGPTFGDGHDLHIRDQCNKDNSSYAEFPTSYNCLSNPHSSSQDSITDFSGATDGKYFCVEEYEVFKVVK